MTDAPNTSGPPSPRRVINAADLAKIRLTEPAAAEVARSQEERLATQRKLAKALERNLAPVRAAMQIGEQVRLAQRGFEETSAMKAMRDYGRQESAAMRAARDFAIQESASVKAVRGMEREIGRRAKEIAGVGEGFRHMAERASRAFESITSPAVKASLRMQEDLERTRRWIDPILEEHRRVERMLAEQTKVDRMLAEQMRRDNMFDIDRDTLFGRTGPSLRDVLVGADIPSSRVARFEKVAPHAPPQLPSREASVKRAALPKPEEKPISFSVDVSTSATFSTAFTVNTYPRLPEPKRSRVQMLWKGLTRKRNRPVVIALSSASATVVVALAGALHPTSPLTWAIGLGLVWFVVQFRDRVTTLVREGQTEPEAFRQALREFRGRRPPEE